MPEGEAETACGERLDARGVTAAVRGMIDEAAVGSSHNDRVASQFWRCAPFDLVKNPVSILAVSKLKNSLVRGVSSPGDSQQGRLCERACLEEAKAPDLTFKMLRALENCD